MKNVTLTIRPEELAEIIESHLSNSLAPGTRFVVESSSASSGITKNPSVTAEVYLSGRIIQVRDLESKP